MDYTAIQKQGILTILHSDTQLPSPPPSSLRRTLSADMSSNNWLTDRRRSLSAIKLKKIASSHGFSLPLSTADSSSSSSSSEGEEEEEEQESDDVNKEFGPRKKRELDSWSSILFQKSADAAPKSAAVLPYVHPLVKKSAASLTENSLLVCTESLGSETGSDGFSSYPPSEDEETMKQGQPPQTEAFEWTPIKFGRKKSPPRSFPPPLPSLSSPDGASVCIHSRRENGRLVLDAVSVPSRKNFTADRRDGRLVLSFVTAPVEEEEDEFQQLLARELEEVKDSEIADDLETAELELEIPMENAPRLSSSVMNFHRLALMMKKKPNGLVNRNPPWPKEKDSSEPLTPLSQSLPPRPPSSLATAATSLNAYEYYWRSKPTGKSAGIQNSIGQQQPQPIKSVTRKLISSDNQMANEKQQVLVLRGNRGDYLVPLSNGCKLPRRSLLLREPCCIATT